MTKIPWIGTSWKMNKLRSDATAFADALKESSVTSSDAAKLFVIPPFPYIAAVADILRGSKVKVGAQNVHWEDYGPWTGEVSAPMVRDCGASMVEIGHSERRAHFNETDETVALKVEAALRNGLIALVCIGDTRAEYDAGRTRIALERQTRAALRLAGVARVDQVIFAYEPVWSIGEGGIPADPDFANAQHLYIKELTEEVVGQSLQVLYGGSVNPTNCCELASKPCIDGLFIGRSAWNVEGYVGIVEAVTNHLGALP